MLSTKKYSHNLKESYFIWWECWEFWARETETPYQLLLFNCSVVSNSLWPHGLQHARFLCPSLSHGAGSNSCPLSQWCHPTIPFSVVPFSSHLQSFPASGSFQMIETTHQVAKLLELRLQHQSFQWTFRVDLGSSEKTIRRKWGWEESGYLQVS